VRIAVASLFATDTYTTLTKGAEFVKEQSRAPNAHALAPAAGIWMLAQKRSLNLAPGYGPVAVPAPAPHRTSTAPQQISLFLETSSWEMFQLDFQTDRLSRCRRRHQLCERRSLTHSTRTSVHVRHTSISVKIWLMENRSPCTFHASIAINPTVEFIIVVTSKRSLRPLVDTLSSLLFLNELNPHGNDFGPRKTRGQSCCIG
jgi:hypothetical protein